MLFEKKEANLIEAFRMLPTNEILLITEAGKTEWICSSILNDERWASWIDSSAKDAPPPDFYNNDEKLMMEVMRVDDHGYEKNGKIINPTYTMQSECERDLIKNGINCDNMTLFVNAITDLPTEEDHNYRYYFANFCRTVEKHKKNIENYKKNHPGHKMIFFVFDESSAYVQKLNSEKKINISPMVAGHPHIWFRDKQFVDLFLNTGIDYLIWFTPYKTLLFPNGSPFDMPKACVYDCNNASISLLNYNPDSMISAES